MQKLIVKGPQESCIHNRALHSLGSQEFSGCHRLGVHGSIGNDEKIITFTEKLSAADRQWLPTLLHQGNTFTRSPGNSDGTGALMFQAADEHALQFSFVFRSHHREVRNRSQITDVVLALMGRAISTDDSCPIEHERDRQVLNAHIVDHLIKCPLQKSAVDRNDRPEPITGHACSKGDGVLFCDPDVDILVWNSFLKQIEASAGCHRCSNAHHLGILFADFHECLSENLAVTGWFRCFARSCFSCPKVKRGLGVISDLISFCVGIPLAFRGDHVNKDWTADAMRCLEGAGHFCDVMAIDRAHVGESQFFEHGAHLRHC